MLLASGQTSFFSSSERPDLLFLPKLLHPLVVLVVSPWQPLLPVVPHGSRFRRLCPHGIRFRQSGLMAASFAGRVPMAAASDGGVPMAASFADRVPMAAASDGGVPVWDIAATV
jgi:hypothetical protein